MAIGYFSVLVSQLTRAVVIVWLSVLDSGMVLCNSYLLSCKMDSGWSGAIVSGWSVYCIEDGSVQ